jgi:putative phage-type endonuclease
VDGDQGQGREGGRVRFTIHDAPQRSPEWFQARAGRLTGSRAADALSFLKGGKESAARRDYRMQLVCERLTGLPQDDGFTNAAMERGIALESAALMAYEQLTGAVAQPSGFLSLTDVMAGCSLDGQVDNFTGIVEIKCPKTATHLGYWRSATVPDDYLPQITHNLWITGAQWCDFLSFDDRLPADMQTVLVRVRRDDLDLAGYEAKALAFLADVDNDVNELKARRAA